MTHTFATSRSAPRIAAIIAALKKKPLPRKSLDGIILAPKTVTNKFLAHLRSTRKIYIHRWARDSELGAPYPIYGLGNCEDAVRPTKLTRAQEQQRYYKKMGDEYDFRVVAKRRAARLKLQRDAMVAALFGSVP